MINLIGKVFGKLKVIEKYDNSKDIGRKRLKWICKCDCGNIAIVMSDHLKNGNTKSCGCLKGKNANLPKGSTRLYNIWKHMRNRCYSAQSKSYKYYGERGISVCDAWNDEFINFYNWAMNNGYSSKLTLDRIDNNGNYEPNNCRWVTQREQNNNRRSNHLITYNDKTLTITQWANLYGINPNTLKSRIRSKKVISEEIFKNDNLGNYSKHQIIKYIDEIANEVYKNITSINDVKYIDKHKFDFIVNAIKEQLK